MGDMSQSSYVGPPVKEPLVARGTRALKWMLHPFIQNSIGGGGHAFGEFRMPLVGRLAVLVVGRLREPGLQPRGTVAG